MQLQHVIDQLNYQNHKELTIFSLKQTSHIDEVQNSKGEIYIHKEVK